MESAIHRQFAARSAQYDYIATKIETMGQIFGSDPSAKQLTARGVSVKPSGPVSFDIEWIGRSFRLHFILLTKGQAAAKGSLYEKVPYRSDLVHRVDIFLNRSGDVYETPEIEGKSSEYWLGDHTAVDVLFWMLLKATEQPA